ncbi:class I SAM-dependent methyltransferase [endosymbiont of Ridgeia piscesae]|uniref:Methyltransferase domain n=1 Tax=endosymbiont of Ridgeia piscesae TaxID=54398 RepID=A0A0T5YV60_9GAMM|nr:class I SAM-dependent methyltransferase [endosymbiont of Ridgeia piscesae]KRT54499.1 Methyltransferase domain [endosymbiont of Ridgeia piscesae]KRT57747.1 Methyltransferase domain-containing protein [endosymbiont of Ridgeia piscesae]
MQRELQAWFARMPGQVLAEQEQALIEEWGSSLFGYHVVQIGAPAATMDLLATSPARHRILLSKEDGAGGASPALIGDCTRLPFATDSVDGVVLPHTLDYSTDPHQALREVERILIPEGRVLITGFNPWSLWGMWQLFRLRRRQPPWCGHFFGAGRIQDWLSLLGFGLERIDWLMYRPPLASRQLMEQLAFLEKSGARFWPMLGGVYLIQAVKRTSTLTPLRPRWRMGKQVLPANAVEPTTRNLHE